MTLANIIADLAGKKKKFEILQILIQFIVIIAQFTGAFFGVLIAYCFAKDFTHYELYPSPYLSKNRPGDVTTDMLYFKPTLSADGKYQPYYGRLIL